MLLYIYCTVYLILALSSLLLQHFNGNIFPLVSLIFCVPLGDYFLRVLKFDISADLHQNAKFNTRKYLEQTLMITAMVPHTHVCVQSVNACMHYYTRSNVQGL